MTVPFGNILYDAMDKPCIILVCILKHEAKSVKINTSRSNGEKQLKAMGNNVNKGRTMNNVLASDITCIAAFRINYRSAMKMRNQYTM